MSTKSIITCLGLSCRIFAFFILDIFAFSVFTHICFSWLRPNYMKFFWGKVIKVFITWYSICDPKTVGWSNGNGCQNNNYVNVKMQYHIKYIYTRSDDSGLYRCRADFKHQQTVIHWVNLVVLGQLWIFLSTGHYECFCALGQLWLFSRREF